MKTETTETLKIESSASDFQRVATRDEGCDDNGEPLCSLPEDQDEPAPLPRSAWSESAPSFYEAIKGIVRSQHHLNTED